MTTSVSSARRSCVMPAMSPSILNDSPALRVMRVLRKERRLRQKRSPPQCAIGTIEAPEAAAIVTIPGRPFLSLPSPERVPSGAMARMPRRFRTPIDFSSASTSLRPRSRGMASQSSARNPSAGFFQVSRFTSPTVRRGKRKA